MPSGDHEARSVTIRRLVGSGLVAILLAIASLGVFLLTRRNDGRSVTASTMSPSSSATPPTSTTLNPRAEVIGRLRTILRIRDEAFRKRNAEILKEVYTVDCPCLEGDSNAIKELNDNNYHTVGGATSLRVRKASRVNDRLWLVIADFRSAPLRIETEDNRLIREEAGGSDLFQFALSKPAGSSDWLLGQATAYQDS
jgi:hypothetical protein